MPGPATTPIESPRARIESERFALARLTRDAALDVPGVHDTDAGPYGRWVSVDHERRVPGVLCVASADGGYDISLGLRCALVPLRSLGTSVDDAVRIAATRNGYQVDDLQIHIVDVTDPGDE